MSKVSVIIPNFNNAQWIDKCIKSCLLQESLKEIIVVDDHSTDNSWEIINGLQRNFPEFVKVFKNPSKGGNNARNFGFEKSVGVYIQWLDSDDSLLAGKFEQQIKALEKEEGDIAYSDWRKDLYNREGIKDSLYMKYGPFKDFAEELVKDNWTSPNNYLLKRSIAEELAGGFGWNPDTKIGQDREYFTMAALLGAKFVYVPGCFAVYNKWSTGTVSGMDFSVRLGFNQVLEKKFKNEVVESKKISPGRKKKYLRIIRTHKIKAFFYNSGIKVEDWIWPWEVHYSLMHWKMALFMPVVFARYYFALIKLKIK